MLLRTRSLESLGRLSRRRVQGVLVARNRLQPQEMGLELEIWLVGGQHHIGYGLAHCF